MTASLLRLYSALHNNDGDFLSGDRLALLCSKQKCTMAHGSEPPTDAFYIFSPATHSNCEILPLVS